MNVIEIVGGRVYAEDGEGEGVGVVDAGVNVSVGNAGSAGSALTGLLGEGAGGELVRLTRRGRSLLGTGVGMGVGGHLNELRVMVLVSAAALM